jgi:hypothetical protein
MLMDVWMVVVTRGITYMGELQQPICARHTMWYVISEFRG